MSDLKLCPFCGGEAYNDSVSCWNPEEEKWIPNFWHRVICKNCGNQTKAFYTKAEAIEAWNRRAERTAKVMSDDVIITVNGYRYHYEEYLCNACKKKVISCDSYCSHCGAKLDWSGNEQN